MSPSEPPPYSEANQGTYSQSSPRTNTDNLAGTYAAATSADWPRVASAVEDGVTTTVRTAPVMVVTVVYLSDGEGLVFGFEGGSVVAGALVD